MAMKRRTVCEFSYSGDLWSIVQRWAGQAGFIEREKEGSRRLYRKGGWGILMAPAFLEIRQTKGRVVLEAWVKADVFLILSFLTGQKPETAIESGGLTAAVPRKSAREAVNRLLVQLNQPPIS